MKVLPSTRTVGLTIKWLRFDTEIFRAISGRIEKKLLVRWVVERDGRPYCLGVKFANILDLKSPQRFLYPPILFLTRA